MGFKPARADIPAAMKPLVEEAIDLGRSLLQTRAVYDFRPVEFAEPDSIDVNGAFLIESGKVFRRMAGCTGLYLTAVTLGPALDRKVAELSRSNDMTRAFLLNAYGAEAAEALMIQLDRILKGLAAEQGLTTTKRFSPGYGDWDITAQKELLGTLQAENIGIKLTDSYLMIPEKSISAIIGVKPVVGGK